MPHFVRVFLAGLKPCPSTEKLPTVAMQSADRNKSRKPGLRRQKQQQIPRLCRALAAGRREKQKRAASLGMTSHRPTRLRLEQKRPPPEFIEEGFFDYVARSLRSVRAGRPEKRDGETRPITSLRMTSQQQIPRFARN